jgi:hypothetical protein
VVAVLIAEAEYWDVKSNQAVQLFKMTRATVTGKPPRNMGEHRRVRMQKGASSRSVPGRRRGAHAGADRTAHQGAGQDAERRQGADQGARPCADATAGDGALAPSVAASGSAQEDGRQDKIFRHVKIPRLLCFPWQYEMTGAVRRDQTVTRPQT